MSTKTTRSFCQKLVWQKNSGGSFIHCDNVTACTLINKGTCKNETVMAALRRIFWYSAIYNFRLRAIYYPGQFNKLADSVSRLHETNGLIELQTAMTNCGYF